MKKLIDFFKLFFGVRGSIRIFLPYVWDRLWWPFWAVAGLYRRLFLSKTKVSVMTGSVGKTTTKRALDCVCAGEATHHSESNYGVGLAKNLLRTKPGHLFSNYEIGIAGPGRMDSYMKMIRPDIVVVTAVKSDHNRSFPTLEDTRKEKGKAVAALSEKGVALLNGDDPNVMWMTQLTKARVVTFGFNEGNHIRASEVKLEGPEGMTFYVEFEGQRRTVRTKIIGKHMVYPLLAALAFASAVKIPIETAIKNLESLEPTPQRMEVRKLPNGVTMIADEVKASLESIEAALETFKTFHSGRRFLLLGDIDEPVGSTGQVYRNLGQKVAQVADRVILVGTESLRKLKSAAVQAGFEEAQMTYVGSRLHEAIKLLQGELREGDVVLVKGAGTQRFQRAVLALEGQPITCSVKYCAIRLIGCKNCPLLTVDPLVFENFYLGLLTRQ